ncbi:MAG: HD domain-containing protein, partial [Candidatus Paceibacterota bacterium]
YGIEKLRHLNLLQFIIPELEENFGIPQNKHHVYGCYEHAVRSLHYAAQQDYSEAVRLASLLHDIGKPESKEGEGEEATFYSHEVISEEITGEILRRLRFPKDKIEKVSKLVRNHLFYYTPEEVGESSVRRLIRKVGLENMDELIQVRKADRIGSGVPKAEPYKLRHLRYVIDKVSQDPISTEMLKVSGDDVMELLDIEPGPKVGQILTILLGKVLEDPQKNDEELLKKKIEELGSLSDEKIKKMSQKAKEKRNEIKTKRDEMLKEKYWVQ